MLRSLDAQEVMGVRARWVPGSAALLATGVVALVCGFSVSPLTQDVSLEHVILKASMCVSGKDNPRQASVQEVAAELALHPLARQRSGALHRASRAADARLHRSERDRRPALFACPRLCLSLPR